jgi:hypothetical protein
MRIPYFFLLCAAGAFVLSSCSGRQSAGSASPQKESRVQPVGTEPPDATRVHTGSGAPASQPVHVEMRNVIFRDDPASVMRIRFFSGALNPAHPNTPPSFDDKHSFTFAIDSAVIATTTADMTMLMNGSVFNYEKSPLTDLRLSTVGQRLKMNATLHKGVAVPIEMTGDLSVTTDGKLRIHADKVRAAHLPVKGMMKALDIQMDDLVDARYARGVSIRGNDMLLDPQFLFPPPYKQGHLTKVAIVGDDIVQTFGTPPANVTATKPQRNYIHFQGGALRFQRLEMRDADLSIIDRTGGPWFDFYLDHYRDQLAASTVKVTPSGALEVSMPDYEQIARRSSDHTGASATSLASR